MATKKKTTKKTGNKDVATASEPTATPVANAIREQVASEANPKKISALAAAAQVLTEAKEPMRAQQLIDEMAKRGLWTSPGGKTPAATLYAAMMREIGTKGAEARFKKTDRGLFTTNG